MQLIRPTSIRSLLLALVCPGLVLAQSATTKPQPVAVTSEQPVLTRAFVLKSIRTVDAADVIQRVYSSARVAWVERNNSVVVRDTEEVLGQVASLLAELDRAEAANPEVSSEAQVYPIRNRPAGEVAELLSAVFDRGRIVADEGSGKLMVSTKHPDRDRIQRMIEQLDVPAPARSAGTEGKTLAVTVDLIQATTGSQQQGALPGNLQDVADELVKAGLGGFKPFGHLMVRTREGGQFQTTGVHQDPRGTLREPAPVTRMRIKGGARLVEGQAELEIECELVVPMARVGQSLSGEPAIEYADRELQLATTATVPLGDRLVLGAMPASLGEADTILLVIQVAGD